LTSPFNPSIMTKRNKNYHISKPADEVKRLEKNWQSLMDMMPEMVLLVREDLVVEYQNSYAINKIGDLCGKPCTEVLCNNGNRCQVECPVKIAMSGAKSNGKLTETKVGDIDVEYTFQPFQGYTDDKLVMILMRDITERKSNQKELEIFNNNVENILRRKITELKESESVRLRLDREVNVLKKKVDQYGPDEEMIGSSKKMHDLKDLICQVADSDATILITGESGTGKEIAANMLIKLSNRSESPFLVVNCSSINENLLESDLFGYEKGAFTGAAARKKGKFEVVDGGTIFLDEIGDISPKMQSSLLRVLQNGELVRVGGTTPIKVDVRIIAATNADLAKAVQDGKFRLDLYYRLNIINIIIPPLRERKDDIVTLASHFVEYYCKSFRKEVDLLPNTVLDLLLGHSWPGNIRELENVIQRAVLMARNNMITERDIVLNDLAGNHTGASDYFSEKITNLPSTSLKEVVAQFEADVIKYVLKEKKGNVPDTAGVLVLGKTALYDKMRRHNINAKMWK
jgi:transcriptional regulator with PAS, ATPase and Fis domain